MILPPSFGLFCQRLGSSPYIDGIDPFSRSRDDSAEFGFGAVFNVETGVVKFTVGPRALDLSSVVSAVVGLYRKLDTRQDELLSEILFDSSTRRPDGSWTVSFQTDGDPSNLWGACELELQSRSVASIVEVNKDLSKKAKLLPIELKPSSTFDRKDPLLTAPVKNIVVLERELRSVVYLDFSNFNPLVVGTGTISYTGGGNRYLPTEDGPKLQALNKAPWLESAKTLIEPAGGNLFSKYALEEKCWEWTSPNGPVVSEGFYTMPGFDARIVNWIVNGVEGINNEWHVYFEEIDWSGETISGSAFLDVKPGSDTNCKFFIGLVAKDSSGALLFEKWEQVEPSSLSVHGVTWAKASSASASPGRIQIALKVVDFNRGDRFEVMAGLPQLEYSPSISSRSVGARVEDSLSFASSAPFSPDYGRFTIEFAPNYSGVPGPCGPQLLLDTRDSTGRNGFWIGHRPDGLFEFGMADNLGSVYVRSASVIQIGDTKHTVVTWWDSVTKSMRIDLDGKTLVDKAMNTMTLPTTLNLYRIGARYNGQHSGTFEIFTFKHEMTTE